MKIFLSWSGTRSRAVAAALHTWLPNVIQSVDPWMSSEDIDAGKRWAGEIASVLKSTRFGIICVTPENSGAPWVLFEAGALAKTIEDTNVVPYLFGMTKADLTGPLAQFQAKIANKEDTLGIIRAINSIMGDHPLPEDRLNKAFDRCWPEFNEELKSIHPSTGVGIPSRRSEKEMLEELLEATRGLSRQQEEGLATQQRLTTILISQMSALSPSPAYPGHLERQRMDPAKRARLNGAVRSISEASDEAAAKTLSQNYRDRILMRRKIATGTPPDDDKK